MFFPIETTVSCDNMPSDNPFSIQRILDEMERDPVLVRQMEREAATQAAKYRLEASKRSNSSKPSIFDMMYQKTLESDTPVTWDSAMEKLDELDPPEERGLQRWADRRKARLMRKPTSMFPEPPEEIVDTGWFKRRFWEISHPETAKLRQLIANPFFLAEYIYNSCPPPPSFFVHVESPPESELERVSY